LGLDYTSGCVNFRDAGEFVNAIMGEQVMAEDKLLRGGKVEFVEDLSEIGFPSTIINLRRGDDIRQFPVKYHHFPISNEYEIYNTSSMAVRLWLNDVIRVFTDGVIHYPVLVHCTSGKDRTGVVVASILKIIGIPHEAIIEEYLLSEGDDIGRDWIEQALAGIGDPGDYFSRAGDLQEVITHLAAV